MQFMSRTGMVNAAAMCRASVSRLRRRGAQARMPHTRGFSLIELAVVLVVITIFLSAILVPLTTQVAQRKTGDTQKTLEEIREALLGYAIANGRLPCPASSTSNGVESPAGGSTSTVPCTNPYNGYVPAATLGLAATDSQGYAIDAWGTRIRYAVTTATTANPNAFTTSNGMRTAGMSALAPDLYVCPTSTGITATTCGSGAYLTNSAVAVIYSLGPNWATGGTGADEAANLNGDKVFVYHTRSDSVAATGEFDDIVIWLSAHVLFSRMVSAGQLP